MAVQTVPARSGVSELAALLNSTEIARLTAELEATRWTGRPGYPIRSMIGMALAKLHPLIPRESPRWTALYRRRSAVEREFGRVKNEWALAPLRVRRIERVRLHTDLTILAKLSCALAKNAALPLKPEGRTQKRAA